MTNEELNKYVEMGDIENDEQITTERAIAELYRWVRVVEGESYEYENLTPKVLNMAIQALSTESKWIPVSERLPDKIGMYLVTLDYEVLGNSVTMLWFHGKEIGWDLRFSDIVIAWMPSPEPYKAESEEEQ